MRSPAGTESWDNNYTQRLVAFESGAHHRFGMTQGFRAALICPIPYHTTSRKTINCAANGAYWRSRAIGALWRVVIGCSRMRQNPMLMRISVMSDQCPVVAGYSTLLQFYRDLIVTDFHAPISFQPQARAVQLKRIYPRL